MAKSLVQSIPFDQYNRQIQVSQVIELLRHNKTQTFKILDVGGYRGNTAKFLAKDNITIIDIVDVDEPNYVKGNALSLPFKDKSFDIVVSFDVLEHIPAKDRQKFMEECSRVASKGIMIAAPQRTPANELAESSLNDLYKSLHDEEHPWLKEHIENGLPDFTKVAEFLGAKGWGTLKLPSNEISLWVAMQGAIFLNSKYPIGAEGIIELNEYYNTHLKYDSGKNTLESYRIILCALTSKEEIDKISSAVFRLHKPISLVEKISLYHQVQRYEATLAAKLNQLGINYAELHQHELNRANTLQQNGEELWRRINQIEQNKDSKSKEL